MSEQLFFHLLPPIKHIFEPSCRRQTHHTTYTSYYRQTHLRNPSCRHAPCSSRAIMLQTKRRKRIFESAIKEHIFQATMLQQTHHTTDKRIFESSISHPSCIMLPSSCCLHHVACCIACCRQTDKHIYAADKHVFALD